MMKRTVAVVVIICLLASILPLTKGYDEAGCEARSNETYFSGINRICRLPLGATMEDDSSDDIFAPLQMNRCKSHTSTKHKSLDTVYGILAALAACLLFGSMFLPVKKFDTGDGMFFQWMMATGAVLVGLVFNMAMWRHQPPFLSFSMIGGILWGTGNVLTVPMLKLVGIGMGQTMVGVANSIGGWISGRFILCQPLKYPIINTVGVVTVIISAILLAFVGSDGGKKKVPETKGLYIKDKESSLHQSVSGVNDNSHDNTTTTINTETQPLIPTNANCSDDSSWVDRLGKWPSRAIGLSMAFASGFLFGFQFLPVEFLRNCDDPIFSCNELDYVFSQYIGIYMSSTIWFIVYCCYKRFRPQVYSQIIIPGIITGVMFALGTTMWFISNKYVGLSIAFPIITSGSGLVSSAWGVLVFREIRGRKNILMFVFAFVVVITGIVLVGVSN